MGNNQSRRKNRPRRKNNRSHPGKITKAAVGNNQSRRKNRPPRKNNQSHGGKITRATAAKNNLKKEKENGAGGRILEVETCETVVLVVLRMGSE